LQRAQPAARVHVDSRQASREALEAEAGRRRLPGGRATALLLLLLLLLLVALRPARRGDGVVRHIQLALRQTRLGALDGAGHGLGLGRRLALLVRHLHRLLARRRHGGAPA